MRVYIQNSIMGGGGICAFSMEMDKSLPTWQVLNGKTYFDIQFEMDTKLIFVVRLGVLAWLVYNVLGCSYLHVIISRVIRKNE